MKQTAQNLSQRFRDFFGDQTPEGMLEYLEDLTDSVSEFDATAYVAKSDYDTVVAERDSAKADAQSMRDRYINRFYQGYSEPNEKGYIFGAAEQSGLEKKEEAVTYESLFE